MAIHFPRTAGEFAEHGRAVIVRCDDCERSHRVSPDVLILQFGADFDCFGSFSELVSQLRCDACGERHRTIYFRRASDDPFEPVNYEDALLHDLEFRALVRARGDESMATRPHRRFGRRR